MRGREDDPSAESHTSQVRREGWLRKVQLGQGIRLSIAGEEEVGIISEGVTSDIGRGEGVAVREGGRLVRAAEDEEAMERGRVIGFVEVVDRITPHKLHLFLVVPVTSFDIPHTLHNHFDVVTVVSSRSGSSIGVDEVVVRIG